MDYSFEGRSYFRRRWINDMWEIKMDELACNKANRNKSKTQTHRYSTVKFDEYCNGCVSWQVKKDFVANRDFCEQLRKFRAVTINRQRRVERETKHVEETLHTAGGCDPFRESSFEFNCFADCCIQPSKTSSNVAPEVVDCVNLHCVVDSSDYAVVEEERECSDCVVEEERTASAWPPNDAENHAVSLPVDCAVTVHCEEAVNGSDDDSLMRVVNVKLSRISRHATPGIIATNLGVDAENVTVLRDDYFGFATSATVLLCEPRPVVDEILHRAMTCGYCYVILLEASKCNEAS